MTRDFVWLLYAASPYEFEGGYAVFETKEQGEEYLSRFTPETVRKHGYALAEMPFFAAGQMPNGRLAVAM